MDDGWIVWPDSSPLEAWLQQTDHRPPPPPLLFELTLSWLVRLYSQSNWGRHTDTPKTVNWFSAQFENAFDIKNKLYLSKCTKKCRRWSKSVFVEDDLTQAQMAWHLIYRSSPEKKKCCCCVLLDEWSPPHPDYKHALRQSEKNNLQKSFYANYIYMPLCVYVPKCCVYHSKQGVQILCPSKRV